MRHSLRNHSATSSRPSRQVISSGAIPTIGRFPDGDRDALTSGVESDGHDAGPLVHRRK